MFAHGATQGKVETWCYHEDEEDFTKGSLHCNHLSIAFKPCVLDATALDTWVFDRLSTLFNNATADQTLNQRLREEKTVFFLHLLGLDTTGHSYRPHSNVTPTHHPRASGCQN